VPRPLTALLLASNEICYNPRLLKAADSLILRGVAVSVFNVLHGNASDELYADCVASRHWEVHAVDLRKRTVRSTADWARTAIVSRLALGAWHSVGLPAGFHLAWNRALIAFPWGDRAFDVTVANLVDNLPMAAATAERSHGAVWYDSQEYFAGDAIARIDSQRARWVRQAQRQCITDATVVTATTQVLADRLTTELCLKPPAMRLRNAPLTAKAPEPRAEPARRADAVRLVWHGFAVHLRGRGVDLLLHAVARCQQPVVLTLQGRVADDERARIEQLCRELGIADAVRFRPPAHPERIVASLADDEVGVIAEPGVDENQRLTSSNKLFEYLHAGLAVIAPDLPGIAETIAGEDAGLLYPAANVTALAAAIDRLAADAELRRALQRRAAAAAERITWAADFAPVWHRLQEAVELTQMSALALGVQRRS
jgi:glycosyltransferase involved in cell wall biosynthesis